MGLMDLFKKKSSGDVAKDRLKLLLVTDRKLFPGNDGADQKRDHSGNFKTYGY